MLLGSRQFAITEIRTIPINYSDWVMPGYALASVVATISAPAVPTITSSVGAIVIDPVQMTAYINLNCGTVVNETFTLLVVAKDTYGQLVNDQLNITIVAPGAT